MAVIKTLRFAPERTSLLDYFYGPKVPQREEHTVICIDGLRGFFHVPESVREFWVVLHDRAGRERVRLEQTDEPKWDDEVPRDWIVECSRRRLAPICEEYLDHLAKRTGRKVFYAELQYADCGEEDCRVA